MSEVSPSLYSTPRKRKLSRLEAEREGETANLFCLHQSPRITALPFPEDGKTLLRCQTNHLRHPQLHGADPSARATGTGERSEKKKVGESSPTDNQVSPIGIALGPLKKEYDVHCRHGSLINKRRRRPGSLEGKASLPSRLCLRIVCNCEFSGSLSVSLSRTLRPQKWQAQWHWSPAYGSASCWVVL